MMFTVDEIKRLITTKKQFPTFHHFSRDNKNLDP